MIKHCGGPAVVRRWCISGPMCRWVQVVHRRWSGGGPVMGAGGGPVGAVLGSFENSYARKPLQFLTQSNISQTVIPFKKLPSGPSKTFIIILIRRKKIPKNNIFFIFIFAYVQLFLNKIMYNNKLLCNKLVQMRTIIGFENAKTNLGHLFYFNHMIYMYKIICDFILITCVKSYRERERESGYFENSYISENSQTINFFEKPTSGAKNRSNTNPVAKSFSEKTVFFFKYFANVKFFLHIFFFLAYMYISSVCFKNAQIPEIFLKCFYRSFHNTYLNGFVKKIEKKMQKKLQISNYNDYERFRGLEVDKKPPKTSNGLAGEKQIQKVRKRETKQTNHQDSPNRNETKNSLKEWINAPVWPVETATIRLSEFYPNINCGFNNIRYLRG
ncbi:hypothetical protein LXL04_007565 [Taraxacum kok-saghyz]